MVRRSIFRPVDHFWILWIQSNIAGKCRFSLGRNRMKQRFIFKSNRVVSSSLVKPRCLQACRTRDCVALCIYALMFSTLGPNELISTINDRVMVTLPAIAPAPSHESFTISRVCLPGRSRSMNGDQCNYFKASFFGFGVTLHIWASGWFV